MKYVYVFLCLFAVLASRASAYSGSISSSAGQINGTGFWVDGTGYPDWTPAVLSWNVTQNVDQTWHYAYTLNVYGAAVSHFILETSASFTIDNLIDPQYPGNDLEINTFTTGASNPSLPGAVYGIKFDSTSGTTINISFDSNRAPVWGDFYAKCGNVGGTQNTVWNEGFLLADPTSAISNGTINNHILVPDSVVPEPATIALLGLGAIALRRKTK